MPMFNIGSAGASDHKVTVGDLYVGVRTELRSGSAEPAAGHAMCFQQTSKSHRTGSVVCRFEARNFEHASSLVAAFALQADRLPRSELEFCFTLDGVVSSHCMVCPFPE